MSKTVFNLLTPLVVQEIDLVLVRYADHPYQQAFADPDLRAELIAYVLSQMPGQYVAISDMEVSTAAPVELSPQVQETMHAWIQQGIEEIIERQAETINQHIPNMDDPGLSPSHWFG